MALPHFGGNLSYTAKSYIDSVATGLNVVSADTNPEHLEDGEITFDTTTNEIKTVSNGQVVTLSGGNDVTFDDVNSGSVLTWSGDAVTWQPTTYTGTFSGAASGYMSYDPVYNRFGVFDTEELSIGENGEVKVCGQIETNPSKIGLALLRAIERKLEPTKTIESMDDICDV